MAAVSASRGELETPRRFELLLGARNGRGWQTVRPISQLTLSLPTLLDSSFPGNWHGAGEIPPLRIKITLESNPLKSRMLVARYLGQQIQGEFLGQHI